MSEKLTKHQKNSLIYLDLLTKTFLKVLNELMKKFVSSIFIIFAALLIVAYTIKKQKKK